MNNYICKHGLYHDKPVVDGEPSSNNGWIYTAFAYHLGFEIGTVDHKTFDTCFEYYDYFFIKRLPDKRFPPMSRDEFLGMVSCGFNPIRHGWYMFNPMYKINYLKAIKVLWSIRKEHRNYVWQNTWVVAYPLAFKLWWHDRYYINTMRNTDPTIFQWIMFQLYAMTTILQSNISAKNVLWLQLSDLESQSVMARFWLKFINQKKNFMKYFGKDHMFNNVEEYL